MFSGMGDLKIGEHDLLSFLKPDTFVGALIYLILFVLLAVVLSRVLRVAVHTAMAAREGHSHLDRTTVSFLQQIGTAAIWVIMLILYAHLIPALRAMGTALLAGASIASVVIGLAAQSTLGNLVAGVAITIYRPFRLGDTLIVTAPTGTEIGTVDLISLGYTTLRTADGRLVVLPNALASSQVSINLGGSRPPVPLTVSIGVGHGANTDAVGKAAVQTAREALGEGAVVGCFLTKIDGAGATLELRARVPDAERDAARSKLLAALSERFVRSAPEAAGTERAVSFS
jgi:small conductance mechanosensitive channel